MTTYIVWMLVLVNGGSYNAGNITLIDNPPSKEACLSLGNTVSAAARNARDGANAKATCVRVERVKP